MSWVCACGKSLRLRESHLGRTVKCPSCGRLIHITSLEGRTGPATTESPHVAQKTTTPSGAVAHRWLPWGLRAGAIVLALMLVAGMVWYFTRSTEDEETTAFIPSDSPIVLHLRPSELWQHPGLRQAFGRPDGAVAKLERWTTLSPDAVRELILVGYRPTERRVWALLKLHQRADAVLLTSHWQDRSTRRSGRRTIHEGFAEDNKRLAMMNLGPQLLLLADPESLDQALAEAHSATASGRSVPRLAGDELALLTAVPPPELREMLRPLLLPTGVGAVVDLRELQLRGTLRDNLDLNARVRLPEEEPDRGRCREALIRARTLAAGLAVFQPDPLWAMIGNAELREENGEMILHAVAPPEELLNRLADELGRRGW